MNSDIIQAAKNKDFIKVIRHIKSFNYDKDSKTTSAKQLLTLMFPEYVVTELPTCYNKPEEWLMLYYIKVTRTENFDYDIDKEMLAPLIREVNKIWSVTKEMETIEMWIHWIKIMYMIENNIEKAHELGLKHYEKSSTKYAFSAVKKYLRGESLDLQERRSMSRIVFFIPELYIPSPYDDIECSICSNISQTKCGLCESSLCSLTCLEKHECN